MSQPMYRTYVSVYNCRNTIWEHTDSTSCYVHTYVADDKHSKA